MTDLSFLAVRATALKLLEDRVKKARAAVNEEMADLMTVGDRKTAALKDGTKVGAITLTAGRRTARVTNPDALARWVAANYPDEVVPQVRPAFLDAIRKVSADAGVGICPDGTMIPDGVDVVFGEAYLSVRPDPAGEPALLDAIRANSALALDAADGAS